MWCSPCKLTWPCRAVRVMDQEYLSEPRSNLSHRLCRQFCDTAAFVHLSFVTVLFTRFWKWGEQAENGSCFLPGLRSPGLRPTRLLFDDCRNGRTEWLQVVVMSRKSACAGNHTAIGLAVQLQSPGISNWKGFFTSSIFQIPYKFQISF